MFSWIFPHYYYVVALLPCILQTEAHFGKPLNLTAEGCNFEDCTVVL